MTNRCACGRPVADAYVCTYCAGRVADALRQVPWLVDDLGLLLTRQVRYAPRVGSRSTVTPVPYDERARSILAVLRQAIVTHHTTLAQHGPQHRRGPRCAACRAPVTAGCHTHHPGEAVTALARALLREVSWFRQHPTGATMVDDLIRVTRRCRAIVDRPPEKRYVGRCDSTPAPACPCACHTTGQAHARPCDVPGGCGVTDGSDDAHGLQLADPGQGCPEELWAIPGAATVSCPRCHAHWNTRDRERWLLGLANDRLFSAQQMERLLRQLGTTCTAERIRQWKKRGKLAQRGYTRAGQPLYRVGDVRALLAPASRTTIAESNT